MRPSIETLQGKKNLVGCEIGVDKAENARTMLKNLDIQRLYLVDQYGWPAGTDTKTIENTQRAVKEFQGKTEIVWLIKKSEDVTDDEIPHDSLDFVYINGCHQYPTVSVDLKQYWPRVKKGGLVAGHDYYVDHVENGVIVQGHGQVKQAVDEFFSGMGYTGYALKEPVPECNFKKFKIFQVYGSDWWMYK